MDRETAIEVVKKIFDECLSIEGKSLIIMPPDANNVFSKGCQIHINGKNDDSLESCLRSVADAESLAVAKEGEHLVIYKPRS